MLPLSVSGQEPCVDPDVKEISVMKYIVRPETITLNLGVDLGSLLPPEISYTIFPNKVVFYGSYLEGLETNLNIEDKVEFIVEGNQVTIYLKDYYLLKFEVKDQNISMLLKQKSISKVAL